MRIPTLATAAVAIALASGVTALAQDAIPVIPLANGGQGMNERLGGAQISAAFVVAARMGDIGVDETFATDSLLVVLPDDAAINRMCVRVTTRDGRYWAENDYNASGVKPGLSRISFPTQYAESLAVYDRADILIRVLTGPCADHDAALLPTIGDMSSGPRHLTVFLNVGNIRTRAKLLDAAERVVAEMDCGAPKDHVAVSFTRVCQAALARGARGPYRLSVERRALTGKRTVSFAPIRLP